MSDDVTTSARRPGLKAVAGMVRTAARSMRLIDRAQSALLEISGGLLGAALTPDELDYVTLRLYALDTSSYDSARGLFPWEREWYADSLPAAPARLLVTAAGRGREVRALRELGYEVDAFEPVPAFAEACAALPGDGETVVTDYAGLCRALLDDGAGPAARFAGRTYDAVILGWGSFTHLLDATAQRRVLAAAAELTPHGPILASFFAVPASLFAAASDKRPPLRRSRRLGAAAGRPAGRLRGLPAAPPDLELYWHLGFVRRFTEAEFREMADALGRRLEWGDPSAYGHAVLAPRD